MNLELDGKTALVLGAGGGLGSAIAATLAREGARVAVCDIDPDSSAATAETIRQSHGNAAAFSFDLADVSAMSSNIRAIESTLGEVDILVNNTGGPPPTPAAGQTQDTWHKHFQSMVLSVIALTDRVLPAMRKRRWGRVITSTSSGVITPIPNLGISNSLRLALVGWSKSLADEVGPDGVTTNVVLPGRIATQRITFLDEQKAKREQRDLSAIVAESRASIPLRRYGSPQEYADVVAFLASERASYITGSVIRIDGGFIKSI